MYLFAKTVSITATFSKISSKVESEEYSINDEKGGSNGVFIQMRLNVGLG
jgi:hypothetical protein